MNLTRVRLTFSQLYHYCLYSLLSICIFFPPHYYYHYIFHDSYRHHRNYHIFSPHPQIRTIEDEIDLGQIEELILIAQDELGLSDYYFGTPISYFIVGFVYMTTYRFDRLYIRQCVSVHVGVSLHPCLSHRQGWATLTGDRPWTIDS